MRVAQPTATKASSRLKREGPAASRPCRHVFYTDPGAEPAERVRQGPRR